VISRQEPSRRRHRTGEPKEKPGKTSWVYGTKLKFFEARRDKWLAATDDSKTGAFYTRMARLYTLKYGYNLGDNEDLAVDIEDPPDEEADRVVNELVDEEVAIDRAKHFKKLREVCGVSGEL
jgi:hypothetical protein